MFHLWGNRNIKPQKNGNSFTNGVTKFSDISAKALQSIYNKGFTHLYATGIIEHATKEDSTQYGSPMDHPTIVKGSCGSPFAIKDYYDVNPFLANDPTRRLEEFDYMLDRIHANKLKIILDFVPNHLARQYYSDKKPVGVIDFGFEDRTDVNFSIKNNFYYLPGSQFIVPNVSQNSFLESPYCEIPARASGNNVFSPEPNQDDWYETVKLNYGIDYSNNGHIHFDPIPDTWTKMLDVLSYWTQKGVDGFRCDMAEMVPAEFWAFVIPKIKIINPNLIFIAEVYQPSLYSHYIHKGGFDYLYDKVGLYDSLRELMEEKEYAHTSNITQVWQKESGEFSDKMFRFLENHDETRINSIGFAAHNMWSTIPAMMVTATLHGGPIMMYFGQEFGESANELEGFNEADDRTTMFDFWRVETHQKWLNNGNYNNQLLNLFEIQLDTFYQKLFHFVHKSLAVQFGQFFDLQYVQNDNYPCRYVYSYLRYTNDEKLLFINNFNSKETYIIELLIPDLAYELMKSNRKEFIISESFFSPDCQWDRIKNNSSKLVQIPPNCSLIYSLVEQN